MNDGKTRRRLHEVATAAPEAEPYHALSPDACLGRLGVTAKGLSSLEAAERKRRFGPNALQTGEAESALVILLRQLKSPLIYVLIAASALALALGKTVDGLVVLGVVVLNALIGFVQEHRSTRAIEALIGMVPDMATVMRDGSRVTLAAADLVPGDVVSLQSGDKVPADVRLLRVKNLRIEEAALTGESMPVEKTTAPMQVGAGLADRASMAYGGTLVTYGSAEALVVATGNATEIGRISSLLGRTTKVETPLTRDLEAFGRLLTLAVVVVAALLVGVGLLRGYPLADAVLAALSLAVAAIPEGLPSIITIALAIGVRRMAGRRAVIRRLPAVETLGSTTVICSDKTGTLTKNEMTVQRLWTRSGAFQMSGVGYEPQGELTWPGKGEGEPPRDVLELLLAGVLCSDASLRRKDDDWEITGDPTEAALVVAAAKVGCQADAVRSRYERRDVIPFESERQLMATLHHDPDAEGVLYAKGSPEAILARCKAAPGFDHAQVLGEAGRFAAEGMRVLAFARRVLPRAHATLHEADIEGHLDFLGLQAMIDPPRQEAAEAVKDCRKAGITVKMITGDHRETARAIARELGILDGGTVLTGEELSRLSDDELRRSVRSAHVFARVAPEHKLRLVAALQAEQEVTAMTGDGVNDAPALKQSDIGIAMGVTGTAVAKEAADVVLTDDNFASIRAAVEEGRRVYDNLVKSLAFVLPTNLGEALIILIAVAFFKIEGGEPLMPILPVQILWINLVATVALALPLAFEAKEPDLMRRPPRAPDTPLLGSFVVGRTVLVALLMTVGGVGLFLYEYDHELGKGVAEAIARREAQTMAVTTVILFQVFYLLNCRSLKDSLLKIGLWTNGTVYAGIGAVLLLQLLFVYAPWMNELFGSSPLNLDAWVKSVLVALSVLPVVSLEKLLRQKQRPSGRRTGLVPAKG